MNSNVPIHLLLQQLLEKEEYALTPNFDKEEVVSSMTKQERELLALLMVRLGEKMLVEDISQAEYYLRRAQQIAPDSVKVTAQACHVLASQTKNIDLLEAAVQGYQKLSQALPEDFDILFHWGNALVHIGRLKQDTAILQEADGLLERADALVEGKEANRQPMMSWLRAQARHALARLSGEASDYAAAVEYYKVASGYDIKVPFFWNDYANALLELGVLMKRDEVYDSVMELYRRGIRLDPRCFNTQYNLAVCYHRLYEKTLKNQYFWHAHEQYSHCKILDDKNITLAHTWGRLLLSQGKLRRDSDLLKQACNQLEFAAVNDKHNIPVANLLSEAFIWCGGIQEDLSLLRHAETTLNDIIRAVPENYDAWCNLAFCQYELGYYFNEPSLVQDAIDKYTHAITLNRANMKAWYGLASCALALGELESNPELLKMSLNYFTQAAEFDGPFFPQFWNDWGVAAMKLAELLDDKDLLEFAITRYEHAIDLDLVLSDGEFVDPEWLYNYGCSFDFLGDVSEEYSYYEKAIQILSRVTEIDPGYLQAKYNLAMAYAHLGEAVDELEALNKACDLFKQLLLSDQDDEMSWNEWGLCLIHMAVLVKDPANLHFQQHLVEAEAKFQHAIALGHLPALYNLACVHSLLGDYATSISFLEKAEANNALPGHDEVLHDDWLEGVRLTEEFRGFWADVTSKYDNIDF